MTAHEITRDEIEQIAKVAAREATHETLISLGIDPTKPLDTQRDFAHLRWWREIVESVTKTAVIAFFLGLGGTIGTLVWLGFRLTLK